MKALVSSAAARRLVAISVVATARAVEGSAAAAAELLALWGVGSFAGGLVFARLGGARNAAALTLLLFAVTVRQRALIPAAGSIAALSTGLFATGDAIARRRPLARDPKTFLLGDEASGGVLCRLGS
jgi:hypothetical protein